MLKSKCCKLSSSVNREASTVDRISELPDPLISHILSFLPTKQAVVTSILSNRWRLLWTCITNLDFEDDSNFEFTVEELFNTKFMNFVDRVLLLLTQPSIHKFRLKCDDDCIHNRICSWIDTAVARGTKELDVSRVYYYDRVSPPPPLPQALFTSTTLVVLTLEGELRLNIWETPVSLPSLKILHLLSVYYTNDECIPNLFANCPVLEDLVVKRVESDGIHCFSICSTSLKKLDINFGFDRFGYEWEHVDYKLEINAPALEYLDLKDHKSINFSFKNLSSLVEANVDINLCETRDVDDDYDSVVYLTLEGLTNVKFLSLWGHTMKIHIHSLLVLYFFS